MTSNRRGFFGVISAVLGSGMLLRPRIVVARILDLFGFGVASVSSYKVELDFSHSGAEVRTLNATVVLADPQGQFFRTTVLQRLQEAGLIEPPDPKEKFYPVASMQMGSFLDSLIKIVTVRVGSEIFRVAGDFWIFVNRSFIIAGDQGDHTTAALFLIQPEDTVTISLKSGQTGTILNYRGEQTLGHIERLRN